MEWSKFFKFYLWFIVILIGLCCLGGPALVLIGGIIVVFIVVCKHEYNKTKTPEGRKQITKQIQREKAIESYWGTVEYNEKD